MNDAQATEMIMLLKAIDDKLGKLVTTMASLAHLQSQAVTRPPAR